MVMAFLRGLGKAPTFLVPIINPPFADNSPHFLSHKTSDEEYQSDPTGVPRTGTGGPLGRVQSQ
jgi:hypothetical protein